MTKLGLLKCPERIVHMNGDKVGLVNRHTHSRSQHRTRRLYTLGRFVLYHTKCLLKGAHEGKFLKTVSFWQPCIVSLCGSNLSVSAWVTMTTGMVGFYAV